ncbi:MAG: hypothetical protein JW891_05120 [Candidatus Lokiarchaeota archaeon]|nr:hypothetical protein [Candidatus Lokiarchaeota archaeon]
MIYAIFLTISFILFLGAICCFIYEIKSSKVDRTKQIGKNLPKFSQYSFILAILALVMLVFASIPYMQSSLEV